MVSYPPADFGQTVWLLLYQDDPAERQYTYNGAGYASPPPFTFASPGGNIQYGLNYSSDTPTGRRYTLSTTAQTLRAPDALTSAHVSRQLFAPFAHALDAVPTGTDPGALLSLPGDWTPDDLSAWLDEGVPVEAWTLVAQPQFYYPWGGLTFHARTFTSGAQIAATAAWYDYPGVTDLLALANSTDPARYATLSLVAPLDPALRAAPYWGWVGYIDGEPGTQPVGHAGNAAMSWLMPPVVFAQVTLPPGPSTTVVVPPVPVYHTAERTLAQYRG